MTAFVACSTLISLGLKKSSLEPATAVRFLGYICDSERRAFILPQDKRIKFTALREAILQNKPVSVKNLQKFSGKTTSFALLVPAAKLYTNSARLASLPTPKFDSQIHSVGKSFTGVFSIHGKIVYLGGPNSTSKLRHILTHRILVGVVAGCRMAKPLSKHVVTGTLRNGNCPSPPKRPWLSGILFKPSQTIATTHGSTYSWTAKYS